MKNIKYFIILLILQLFFNKSFSNFILKNYEINPNISYYFQIKALGLPLGYYYFHIKSISNINNNNYYYCEEIYEPTIKFNTIFLRPNKGKRYGIYLVNKNNYRLYYAHTKYEGDITPIGVEIINFNDKEIQYNYYYPTNIIIQQTHNGILHFVELYFLTKVLDYNYYLNINNKLELKFSLWTNTLNIKVKFSEKEINYKKNKIKVIFVEEIGNFGAYGYMSYNKKIPIQLNYPFLNIAGLKSLGVTLELIKYTENNTNYNF